MASVRISSLRIVDEFKTVSVRFLAEAIVVICDDSLVQCLSAHEHVYFIKNNISAGQREG